MTQPDDPKSVLRDQLRHRTAPPDEPAASRETCARLAAWEAFKRARTILAFLPMAGEPDLRPALRSALARGATLCLPRVDWPARRLTPASVADLDRDVVTGPRGVPEPAGHAPTVPVADLELVLVPGVAFDTSGGRMGRGSGFYDRFLPGLRPGVVVCGVSFEGRIVPVVPMNPHDVRVGWLLTDQRLFRCPGSDSAIDPARPR